MKPKFKFCFDFLNGCYLAVLNYNAHKLALKMQEEDIESYYPIWNNIELYYYDIPIKTISDENKRNDAAKF